MHAKEQQEYAMIEGYFGRNSVASLSQSNSLRALAHLRGTRTRPAAAAQGQLSETQTPNREHRTLWVHASHAVGREGCSRVPPRAWDGIQLTRERTCG